MKATTTTNEKKSRENSERKKPSKTESFSKSILTQQKGKGQRYKEREGYKINRKIVSKKNSIESKNRINKVYKNNKKCALNSKE